MTTAPAETVATARTEELATRRGETTIRPTVVAKIAERAATEVDGIEVVASGGMSGLLASLRRRPAGAEADVASRRAALELTVAVCWPRSVRAVTDEARRHVKSRVQELTGHEVTDVDIIVGALPSPPPRRRVR